MGRWLAAFGVAGVAIVVLVPEAWMPTVLGLWVMVLVGWLNSRFHR